MTLTLSSQEASVLATGLDLLAAHYRDQMKDAEPAWKKDVVGYLATLEKIVERIRKELP